MSESPTTPPKIDKAVRKFCREINASEDPVFVDVRPAPDCLLDECFNNLPIQIERNGGKSVTGWTVWYIVNRFIEAEFHCVWQSGEKLIDVTPKRNRERKILFLPDSRTAWSGRRVPNIRRSLCDDPFYDWLIRKAEAHDELDAKHQTETGQSAVPLHLMQNVDRHFYAELRELVDNGVVSQKHVMMPTEKIGRNAPCPCGSGKKHKRCCG